MLLILCIVCASFYTTIVDLFSCFRDRLVYKAENIYYIQIPEDALVSLLG